MSIAYRKGLEDMGETFRIKEEVGQQNQSKRHSEQQAIIAHHLRNIRATEKSAHLRARTYPDWHWVAYLLAVASKLVAPLPSVPSPFPPPRN